MNESDGTEMLELLRKYESTMPEHSYQHSLIFRAVECIEKMRIKMQTMREELATRDMATLKAERTAPCAKCETTLRHTFKLASRIKSLRRKLRICRLERDEYQHIAAKYLSAAAELAADARGDAR